MDFEYCFSYLFIPALLPGALLGGLMGFLKRSFLGTVAGFVFGGIIGYMTSWAFCVTLQYFSPDWYSGYHYYPVWLSRIILYSPCIGSSAVGGFMGGWVVAGFCRFANHEKQTRPAR
ncbi:MAG: hypothetical protein AB2L14_12885, partial [Candidatus Xenobiia bacterium LiM19]